MTITRELLKSKLKNSKSIYFSDLRLEKVIDLLLDKGDDNLAALVGEGIDALYENFEFRKSTNKRKRQ